MKRFKKYLKENYQQQEYEKNRREMLDSIRSMPLEDAKTLGELDLVSGEPIFVDTDYGPGYGKKINDNHAFTKFLSHPDHSNESAREHINYLLKVAHARDRSDGSEKLRHLGNENQRAVLDFARENYPKLAYAMAISAVRANSKKPGSYGSGSGFSYSKEPIQITPEHLDQINQEHGVIGLSPLGFRDFVDSHKDSIMSSEMADWHIDAY